MLFEEAIYSRRIWEHLENVVREGPAGKTGSQRAWGKDWVEMLATDPTYKTLFNDGMTSYSGMAHQFASKVFDWTSVKTVADIGGNEGQLISMIANEHPHITGYVLDVPAVIANSSIPQNPTLFNRIRLVRGSFFTPNEIEPVDVYISKHVLHDWSDDECVKILKNIHSKAPSHAKLLNFDFVVPPPRQADNGSMGLDVHMMACITGRDREESELTELLGKAGWKVVRCVLSPSPLGMIEAVKV
ncbi:hypothetical protein HDU67_002137 [Dinochytrium kinnereticum]|nr:hypothetical protein HDU67_002137 [Dinochytrium kinnereticum]